LWNRAAFLLFVLGEAVFVFEKAWQKIEKSWQRLETVRQKTVSLDSSRNVVAGV
jgi:hypothetical protein